MNELEPLPHPTATRAKEYRESLGLTQEEFASRFGLPLQTYRQWERGRRQPEMSGIVLLTTIVDFPDHVIKSVRRYNRRELALA